MWSLRGAALERFKFAIYIFAPIGSVYLFSLPAVHETFMTTVRASLGARRGAALARAGVLGREVKRAACLAQSRTRLRMQ